MSKEANKGRLFAGVVSMLGGLYRRVLGEEMGAEARTFLKNLSFVTVGSGIATLFTFAFGVLGGRILGPVGYGEFGLVIAAADFLVIPMTLGFSVAMVRYLSSEQHHEERQSTIAATTYTLVILCTAVCVFIFLILRSRLSAVLSLDPDLFYFSLAIAVLYAFHVIMTSTVRGLGRMRAYAILQPVYATILLLSFLLFAFIRSGTRSFEAMAYPQALAYGFAGVIAVVFLGRAHFKVVFDRSWASVLAGYAVFALVAGMASATYTNVGKILISRYMTVADVGIYSAYYSPSLNVATLMFLTFNSVFFPAASRYADKKAIFNKIDRLLPYLIVAGTPMVFGLEYVILTLYGGRYPIDPVLMLIFAVSAVLIVWYGIYSSTFNSEGLKGIKMTNVSVATIALLDVALSLVLIPRLGLRGAIGSIAVSFAAGVVCLRVMRSRLLANGSTPAAPSGGR